MSWENRKHAIMPRVYEHSVLSEAVMGRVLLVLVVMYEERSVHESHRREDLWRLTRRDTSSETRDAPMTF